MTKRAVLGKRRVRLVQAALRAMTGLELPHALILDVAGSDAELLAELKAADGALDTEVRELFQEVLAQRLIGRSWPLRGEGNAESLDAIRDAVEARGGTFVPPAPRSALALGVRALEGGVFHVVVRGRIDGTNYTRLGDAVVRAVLRRAPRASPMGLRLALDVSGLELGEPFRLGPIELAPEALMAEALERVLDAVVLRGRGALAAFGAPVTTSARGLQVADSLQHAVALLRP